LPSFWAASLALISVAHAADFERGVCYAHAWKGSGGYGSETSQKSLARLKQLGVDAISLTPFGYQWSLSSDSVRMATHMGESDVSLAKTTEHARALGMRVMLKPHIWVRGGGWIGEQSLPDDAAWARWFASYRSFIVHYAELAQREKMDALVLGTELKRASQRDRESWREIIAAVRAVYKGRLIYAANWDEAEKVVFWDLVDEIGVQEYEPLTDKKNATPAELRAGWTRIVGKLDALAKRTGKPIVLTEIGYRAMRDAAISPSSWPEHAPESLYDGEAQAECYRAAFAALRGRPWLRGIYIWKWFTDSQDESGPTDFSPAGKPAEKVLREFYRAR
jgi:hypothetical protein